MEISRQLSETILPLTNSRGFAKVLRFEYNVGPECDMPLVVSPQILAMGEPHFTRQLLYFLGDLDCAIRMYQISTNTQAPGNAESVVAQVRRAADDCLFEYSIHNPSSRLTTKSDIRPKRVCREEVEITIREPGSPEAHYLATDNERVYLGKKAKESFDQLYGSFLTEIHDNSLGRFEGEMEAWPSGLTSEEGGAAPVRFSAPPYTLEEIELLSRIVPAHPEVVGKLLPSGALTPLNDRFGREVLIGLLNQPYIDRVKDFPPGKWVEAEIFEVTRSYNTRLLDFYFAGLSSLSPVVEFKNYYNIIEYFFEDATFDSVKSKLDEIVIRLRETDDFDEFAKLAKTLQPAGAEDHQIRQVIQRYVSSSRLRAFFRCEISQEARVHFESFSGLVSGRPVQKVRVDSEDLQQSVADRIYAFRNAIFHSKRTLKGKESQSIRPGSTEEEVIVRYENLLIKMIAQEIIRQSEP